MLNVGSLENPVDMDFCLKIHNTPQNEMIFVSGFWQLVFVTNPNYHQPHFLENLECMYAICVYFFLSSQA